MRVYMYWMMIVHLYSMSAAAAEIISVLAAVHTKFRAPYLVLQVGDLWTLLYYFVFSCVYFAVKVVTFCR